MKRDIVDDVRQQKGLENDQQASRQAQSDAEIERLLSHLLNLGPVAVAGERSADIASTMIEGVEALEPYFSRYLPQMALVSLIPLAILVFVFPATGPANGTSPHG